MEAKVMLEELLEYRKMNVPTFAQYIGVSAQTLYDILRGKTLKISARLKARILVEMPEVRREWLFNGEGEMLKPSTKVVQSVEQNNIHGNNNNTATSGVDYALLEEIAAHRRQVDELIAIIRDMQKNK